MAVAVSIFLRGSSERVPWDKVSTKLDANAEQVEATRSMLQGATEKVDTVSRDQNGGPSIYTE